MPHKRALLDISAHATQRALGRTRFVAAAREPLRYRTPPAAARFVVDVEGIAASGTLRCRRTSAVPTAAATSSSGRRIEHLKPIVRTSPPWSSGTYSYDAGGNIKAIGTDTFAYDGVNRLTSSSTRGSLQTFAYDSFGNRTSASTLAGACANTAGCAIDVTVNHATNRLTNATVAGTTYTTGYDFAGNVTSFAGTTFSWDSLSVMTARSDGQAPQFVYDANDERIGTHAPTFWTWTIRDTSGRVVREYTASTSAGRSDWTANNWTWTRDHIYRGDQALASITPNGGGTTEHFHLDHLGTPRLVTVNGTETGFKTYYPYGSQQAAAPIESPEENLRFTGHEFDAANNGRLDTFYMHARYYAATAGRFLSVDPSQRSMRPGIPQSWNRYSYAIDNPIRYTDPYGLDWFKIDDKWQYLKDVHEMCQFTYNKASEVTGSQVIKGTQFGLVFNGTGLTQLRADGTMRTIPAVSGRVSGWGEVHPGMQADRGRGPIPAGQYSFNPRDIQSIPAGDRVLGLVGRDGWPGGTYAWGSQRVFLILRPERTRTVGVASRSMEANHRGRLVVSRDMVNTFFSEIPRNVDQIPLDVDYNNPLPKP